MIKIIEPSVEIISPINYQMMIAQIELAGRTCYKSDSEYTKDSSERFIEMLIKRGHESVLEHQSISVRFIGSRTMSHQLVRHRIAAYSQESQRYCNYNKNDELEVIKPKSIKTEQHIDDFIHMNRLLYATYQDWIDEGVKPEDARSILPNCTKTEIVVTMNIRQWRHFFRTRCDKHAQEEIRTLATDLLHQFKTEMPSLVSDLEY